MQDITEAGIGDKCLMDTLIPAVEAFEQAHANGASFNEALDAMKNAAAQGRDSTKDLMAKSAAPAVWVNARWVCWMRGRCRAA
ncbi:Uncharacterized protein ALO86_04939 [Pseudomonas syringae pv. berberidis]|nr:Uncharacterized protein ALO86_04939 [Pseudomonas syringae pv. berberidis]RMM18236.1 hypothetical protein ALQ83_04394 [Pseudomonas syringae pv. berberidis]